MKIEQYAPIVIPTLNRVVHFRRCLESLERCTGAELTDVYVGLDYPPAEKYVDGWKKINEYLAEKEKKNGFKNLFVFRRDHNCGVVGPESNYQLLKNVVEPTYDRFISSEDDNEFSPNFLEFMNQGLEFYKDDPRVLFVSAYTPPLFNGLTDMNSFFGIDTPAYGLGRWTYKKASQEYSNEDIAKDLRKSLFNSLKLYWTWPSIVGMAINMINKGRQYGDVRYSMYNLLHHTFTLQPSVSLSRNWGCDGSGLHSGVLEGKEKEVIQQSRTFELQDIPHEYPPELLKRIFFRNLPSNKLRTIKSLIVTFLRLIHFYFKK